MCRAVPDHGSKVAIIDECGHIPQVAQLDQTATAVDGFLG
jgi:hypothetical protein